MRWLADFCERTSRRAGSDAPGGASSRLSAVVARQAGLDQCALGLEMQPNILRISSVPFASTVQVAREVHELGLFTQAEMMASFQQAGLAATYDSSGLTGRGLYVARVDP